MVAPCPYTLCCFRFGNGEWGFFSCILHVLWLRRLPSRSKERRTWTVTRRRQIYLHWLAKDLSENPKLPENISSFFRRNAGLTLLAMPGSDEQRSKGCPYFHRDATQNPSGFSYGWLGPRRSPYLIDMLSPSSHVNYWPVLHKKNAIA